MNNKLRSVLVMIGLAVPLLAACQQAPQQIVDPAEIANPASVYCASSGHKEESRTDTSGGQYSVCVFADGTECESWAFFRGECGQDKSFCTQKGGTLEARNGVATCTLPDGTSCAELAYSQGWCGTSQ